MQGSIWMIGPKFGMTSLVSCAFIFEKKLKLEKPLYISGRALAITLLRD